MNALKFLKAYKKMCTNYGKTCGDCPLKGMPCNLTSEYCNYEEVFSIVKQWEKEHPVKTRQSEFLKQFPDVELDEDGVINISPCLVSKDYRVDCNNIHVSCSTCRQTYWMEEIEC